MELIIKISDKMFDTFKQHGIMTFDNLDEYDRDMIADAIANGTPYNPLGDLISREALKEHKVYSEERHEYVVPVYNIDNAQAIPLPSNQIAWEQGYEAGLAQGKVEITEEQAINKLHETGWLIGHDKEMTTRPQGEWIKIDEEWYDYKCSVCGEKVRRLYPFCHCGADMRGEEE